MTITIEAIYEAGVFKPLEPLPNLAEHEKVRVTVETESLIERQARTRLWSSPESVQALLEAEGPARVLDLLFSDTLEIDPAIAREIAESADFSMLES